MDTVVSICNLIQFQCLWRKLELERKGRSRKSHSSWQRPCGQTCCSCLNINWTLHPFQTPSLALHISSVPLQRYSAICLCLLAVFSWPQRWSLFSGSVFSCAVMLQVSKWSITAWNTDGSMFTTVFAHVAWLLSKCCCLLQNTHTTKRHWVHLMVRPGAIQTY